MVPTLQKVPLKLKIVCKFCVSVSLMREFLYHHLSLSLVSLSPATQGQCVPRGRRREWVTLNSVPSWNVLMQHTVFEATSFPSVNLFILCMHIFLLLLVL